MYILNTQMDTAGADGLGQAVVGVVIVMGEDLHPAADQAGGDGLSADVHQTPLGQAELAQIHATVIDGIQQILSPGNQQPDDGALFFGHGPEDPLRLDTPEEYGLGTGQEATEPVHFGAGVVEGRNAQEYIITALRMVVLLGQAGADQSLVLVQDGLGETGGTGGEVDGSIVLLVQSHGRCAGGAEAGEGKAVLGVSGAVVANVEHGSDIRDLASNGIHTADKFGAEDQHFHVRQFQTIFNFVAGIAEVHGHGDAACLQNTKVNGQPLDAVHQQHSHLGTLLQATAQQQVGKAVRTAVKILPADLAAVGGILTGAFDQVEIPPGHGFVAFLGWVDFYQRGFTAVESCIFFQKISNNHVFSPFPVFFLNKSLREYQAF